MNAQLSELKTTARITGICYLMLAVSGIFGFLGFHDQIYVHNDPGKTLANLTDRESLARVRLLFEFAIIISQALAAVGFYKLFKSVNDWAAWALGIWGMMNAAIILISAIAMGSALNIAHSAAQQNDKVVLIQLLEQLSTNAWSVGGIFFGLWLIPMGYIVVSSKRMPIWLGHTLIAGGLGYLLSTFIKYAGVNNPAIDAFTIPATVGELWMIGYLLSYGIRPSEK